jgi:hypothetical protein
MTSSIKVPGTPTQSNGMAADTVTPLAVMLEAMQLYHRLAHESFQRDDEMNGIKRMEAAAKIAQDAAPYFHARLATVAPPAGDGGRAKQEYSELEIGRRLAFVMELFARGSFSKPANSKLKGPE